MRAGGSVDAQAVGKAVLAVSGNGQQQGSGKGSEMALHVFLPAKLGDKMLNKG
jgi:hypothetical protein